MGIVKETSKKLLCIKVGNEDVSRTVVFDGEVVAENVKVGDVIEVSASAAKIIGAKPYFELYFEKGDKGGKEDKKTDGSKKKQS